jgi:hypothetical protein
MCKNMLPVFIYYIYIYIGSTVPYRYLLHIPGILYSDIYYDRTVFGAKATDMHRQTDEKQGSHSTANKKYG